MPMTLEQFGLDKLSGDEKRQVMELLDESLAAEADMPPLTPAQIAELERRVADYKANPHLTILWEQVRDGARERIKARRQS